MGLPVYQVNTNSLGLIVEDTDFLYSGRGPKIELKRTWSSPSFSGMFGNGWSSPYVSRIKNGGTGIFLYRTPANGMHFKPAETAGMTTRYVASMGGSFDSITGYNNNAYFIRKEKKTGYLYRYDYSYIDADGFGNFSLTSVSDKNGNIALIHYNPDGTISSIEDAANRSTTFTYDGNKRCTQMQTPNNKTILFTYDTAGNLETSTDLLGTTTTYTYDPENYVSVILVTDPAGGNKTTNFAYTTTNGIKHLASATDASGATEVYEMLPFNQTKITDPNNISTLYTSDEYGRTINVTRDPSLYPYVGKNISESFGYDPNGFPSSYSDPNGHIVSRQYDAKGNLTMYTDGRGKITEYEYDTATDNLLFVQYPTNVPGERWGYAYDANSNLLSITSPENRITGFEYYPATGEMKKITDAGGGHTDITYDAAGNVETVTSATGGVRSFVYDGFGLDRLSSTDPNGNTLQYAWDNNRRLTRITYPGGAHKDLGYDACALKSVSDEHQVSINLTRDKLLRVTDITDPYANVYHNEYDGNGNLLSVSNPMGETYTGVYDAINRLISLSDPMTNTVSLGYDPASNLTSLTNELSHQSLLAYNENNELSSIKDPLQRTLTLARDELGRITEYTNARTGKVTYSYDKDGVLAGKSYNSVPSVTYVPDATGRLATVQDSTGTTTYGRDLGGRINSITYSDGKVVTFSYYPDGSIRDVVYPGGLTATNTLDARNRIKRTAWGTGSYIDIAYESTGDVYTETRSNGVVTQYSYDLNHRLLSIADLKDPNLLVDLRYTRDAAGKITGQTNTVQTAARPSSMSIEASHDIADQLQADGPDTFTFNADGSLTAISGIRIMSASYDIENRPTTIVNGTQTTDYIYNGVGERVRATRGTEVRNFHYDHWGKLLFETDGAGLLTVYYIYVGRGLAAAVTAAGATYFYHFDHIGSTIAITDEAGSVVNSYSYEPYGEILSQSETIYNSFRFVGKYGVMDEGNGIYFMKNRYYDSQTGRFMQKDPIGFAGGINLYEYAGNNPVNNIDPSGTSWWLDITGAWGSFVNKYENMRLDYLEQKPSRDDYEMWEWETLVVKHPERQQQISCDLDLLPRHFEEAAGVDAQAFDVVPPASE